MAKTIEEMAYKSLLDENVNSTDSDYSRGLLKGYKKGANAVLSEIEQAIKGCDVDGSPYVAVLDRIKQLKGESV